jgi:hypothetical protein
MKRLLSLAAAGLMCGAAMFGTSGIAGAATASTPIARTATFPGGPMIRAAGHGTLPTVSLNWSGYAVTSRQQFNHVSSSFVQPAIKCPGIAGQYTSEWVGLDGFNDQTVEQDGTSGYCGGPNHTTPIYKAWYEMFPAGSVNVFTVHPGDMISAAVNYASGDFTLTISDLTTGKSATTSATCSSCARASAEWIIERPAVCNNAFTHCFLTELANYGQTTMAGDTASVDGGKVKGITGFANNYSIFMVNSVSRGFITLDTVSQATGPSFQATWDRSGTKVPITLGPRR